MIDDDQPKLVDPFPLSPERQKHLAEMSSEKFKALAMEAKRLREEDFQIRYAQTSKHLQ